MIGLIKIVHQTSKVIKYHVRIRRYCYFKKCQSYPHWHKSILKIQFSKSKFQLSIIPKNFKEIWKNQKIQIHFYKRLKYCFWNFLRKFSKLKFHVQKKYSTIQEFWNRVSKLGKKYQKCTKSTLCGDVPPPLLV